MKKYIDGLNSLMRGYQSFGDEDLVRGLERADDLPGDAVMRRKILILNQIKANEGRILLIRNLGKNHMDSKIDVFLSNMKSEIFSEFDQNTFADVRIDSLCDFMKKSAMRSEKITEESYINWFIDEMALVEDFTPVDTIILKEFAPEDVESTIKYLTNDIVAGKLSDKEKAHIALATLTNKITDVTLPELKSLMQYMFLESDEATPIDFMVTIVENRLDKDFDNEYLRMFLDNENLECSTIAEARNMIAELSDEIAGIEEDKDAEDSGLASGSGASSPEHIEEDEESIEVSENPAATSGSDVAGDQEFTQAEQINAAKLSVNTTTPSGDTLKRSCPSYIEDDDDTPPAKRSCEESTYNLDEIIDVVSPNPQASAQSVAIDASVHQSPLAAPTTYIGGEVENFWD